MSGDKKEQMWKVKAEDGSIFGPASMATLLAWARDGRLAATHVISSDGKNWVPVTSRGELAMDWIAEISPGKFFGPIHRDAMDELIRSGDVGKDMPQYVRTRTQEDRPSNLREQNETLRAQIETLKADFANRIGELESKLAKAESANAELKSEIETRDLDFDAERQGFKATETRIQAELAKAEKKSAALAARMEQNDAVSRNRASEEARIAELESKIALLDSTLKKVRSEADEAAAESRRAIRKAETDAQSEQAKLLKDMQANASRLKAMDIREESLKKLLQQAMTVMNSDTQQNDAVVDAEVVTIE